MWESGGGEGGEGEEEEVVEEEEENIIQNRTRRGGVYEQDWINEVGRGGGRVYGQGGDTEVIKSLSGQRYRSNQIPVGWRRLRDRSEIYTENAVCEHFLRRGKRASGRHLTWWLKPLPNLYKGTPPQRGAGLDTLQISCTLHASIVSLHSYVSSGP